MKFSLKKIKQKALEVFDIIGSFTIGLPVVFILSNIAGRSFKRHGIIPR